MYKKWINFNQRIPVDLTNQIADPTPPTFVLFSLTKKEIFFPDVILVRFL